MHDTEDKNYWCEQALAAENYFVSILNKNCKLDAKMNPEKDSNKFAPDLWVEGGYADLKMETTPFFMAQRKFYIDPQFAVTFNEKDFIRYSNKYPDIVIYFWVRWETLTINIHGMNYSVKPMRGIWRTTIPQISQIIKDKKSPLHSYQRRQNGNSEIYDGGGNAKGSYVFDLRNFEQLRLDMPMELPKLNFGKEPVSVAA